MHKWQIWAWYDVFDDWRVYGTYDSKAEMRAELTRLREYGIDCYGEEV